mgnify:CR=1 FL=1
MFSNTSYSYERLKKTSTLLSLFIFYTVERIILERSPDVISLCSFGSYYKCRNSKHLSFDQKWRLQ